ncbi:serpin (serine protease inhibitor) domain-containing protein [Phthorimaea operculella]|nr:serpin (serine protease inhibitor) domain-containing protein [Phthorimaea operculella]
MIKPCVFVVVVANVVGIANTSPKQDTFTNTLTTLFELQISMVMMSQANVSMVVMPLPIRVMLCKLMQVARGQAWTEIKQAFSFLRNYKHCYMEVPGMNALLRQFTIILMNKIYVNDTKNLNPYFFEKSSTLTFGVHVEKRKFIRPKSARTYINQWFDMVSLKHISDILEHDDVNENTSILAVSAAHIKSSWERPFNILHTKKTNFRTLNGTKVPVQMMNRRGEYLYYYNKALGFKILSIPLSSYGMSMTFILPVTPNNFANMARAIIMNPNVLQSSRNAMRFKIMSISLPRFRIKSTHVLNDALKLMGINQIFNTTYSGLEGLLQNNTEVRNMYLSLVKQQVILDVDEMGAYRLGIPKENSDELDKKFPLMKARKVVEEFVADQPFLFSIDVMVSYSGDQSMLLVGAYVGPDE